MNLQKYLAFVKTVEYGSFTRAAEALSYSQPGVSRMIADLEQELRVSLLERGKGGVRLTSDGMQLLPCAAELCAAFQKLQMQVDSINGLQSGLIRIGTFSSVAINWLPPIIKEFQKDYPNIDYELLLGDYAELDEWVLQGRVDCSFCLLPVPSELEAIFLERDQLMAVIPTDHPLAKREVFPLKALCEMPFLLLEKGPKTEVSVVFERYGLTPDVRFTTWDDYAIMAMVESGLGVSILPSLILKRVPCNILIKPLDVPAYREIGLALRDRRTASLAVKRFMDYLEFRNAPGQP